MPSRKIKPHGVDGRTIEGRTYVERLAQIKEGDITAPYIEKLEKDAAYMLAIIDKRRANLVDNPEDEEAQAKYMTLSRFLNDTLGKLAKIKGQSSPEEQDPYASAMDMMDD